MPRPRTLDDTKRREISALLAAGSTIRHAAKYVGCSVSTIHRETARNPEFREQLRHAEASARLAPLQAMRQAAQTHWRAAAWMLERTDPEQFGRPQPQALGTKELRALARDLLAIFDQEINHPVLRKRLSHRIQAAISYAMRHAWDTHRTGKQLTQAMQFFDKREAKENININTDAYDYSFLDNQLAPQNSQPATQNSFATPTSPSDAKLTPFCNTPGQQTPSFTEQTQTTPAQNPIVLQ